MFSTGLMNGSLSAGEKAEQAEWSALFNGENLDGWKSKSNGKTGGWTVAGRVPVDEANARKFAIQPGKGVLVNGEAGPSVRFTTARDGKYHLQKIIQGQMKCQKQQLKMKASASSG